MHIGQTVHRTYQQTAEGLQVVVEARKEEGGGGVKRRRWGWRRLCECN